MKKRGNCYSARQRRIRILKLRRTLFIACCVGLLIMLIWSCVSGWQRLGKILSERNDTKQIEILKNAEIPDYVDIQLIDKGNARSGKSLDKVRDIVIHYVGNPNTTAQNNRDYFNRKSTTVCSHFVVGLDGEIIQCVPLNERSAASNNRNKDTISIEVCHPDSSGKFNDCTYDSLVKLTSWLCDTAKIDRDAVIRHYDVTGKLCPLYYVENEDKWLDFKSDVKEWK